jgi:hypothetical protein
MRQRLREWSAQPPTWKDVAVALGGLMTATTLAVVGFGLWVDSQFDAGRDDDAKTRQRVDRIDDRVVRIERTSPGLCRQSEACRAAIQRRKPPAAPTPGREPRRDRENAAPEQRADRPPRAPSVPPSTPTPTPPGGGGPPDPPSSSTPVTPPSSPAAPTAPNRPPTVRVDPPAIDIDGDRGLLPELLPDVNLPEVKLPAVEIRLDQLPRLGP